MSSDPRNISPDKPLKPLEKAFLKEYLENGNNGTAAVKKVFPPMAEGSARVKASWLLTRPNILALVDNVIPDSLLRRKHMQLLNKTEKKVVQGEVITDIDTQAVSKALDMAYKLKGSYAAEKKEISGSLNTIPPEELEALAKQINDAKRSNSGDGVPSNGTDSNAVDPKVQS